MSQKSFVTSKHEIDMTTGNLFKKIMRGEIPSDKVYEDDEVFEFEPEDEGGYERWEIY